MGGEFFWVFWRGLGWEVGQVTLNATTYVVYKGLWFKGLWFIKPVMIAHISLDKTIDICMNQLVENTDTVEGFTKSKLK